MTPRRTLLSWALALAGCTPTPARDGGACTYDAFEGTCTLTDVWVAEDEDAQGVVTVEAQYQTPRGAETLRHRVDGSRAERLRKHLAAHPSVPCQGRVITSGTCEPSSLRVELPTLEAPY